MWPARYFNKRYWANRYFPSGIEPDQQLYFMLEGYYQDTKQLHSRYSGSGILDGDYSGTRQVGP